MASIKCHEDALRTSELRTGVGPKDLLRIGLRIDPEQSGASVRRRSGVIRSPVFGLIRSADPELGSGLRIAPDCSGLLQRTDPELGSGVMGSG